MLLLLLAAAVATEKPTMMSYHPVNPVQTAYKPTLLQKQFKFTQLLVKLLDQAHARGYKVTLGETWRSVKCASFQTQWNELHGIGIADSLHIKRLAVDLNLFDQKGRFLTQTKDYKELGEWWEGQVEEGFITRWGGRFKRTDGSHFSIEHEGVQ